MNNVHVIKNELDLIDPWQLMPFISFQYSLSIMG